MTDPAKELIRLAMERFGNLLPAEAKMLRAAADGTVADVADLPGDETLTRESEWGCWEKWGEHRKIRAEVLRWVLVNEEAAGLVHEHGVQANNARLLGSLDLDGATVRPRLILGWCAIERTIDVMRAKVRHMNLGGSFVRGMVGDGVAVYEGLFFRDGCRVMRGLRLNGARIGGSFECDSSTVANLIPDNPECDAAIAADGMRVGGSVLLRDGFRAIGEIRLIGAEIGGQLNCERGCFLNPPSLRPSGGCAICADTIHVGGGVLFRNGMEAYGEVRLLGATIGGQLSCSQSRFWNPLAIAGGTGVAFNADRMRVRGTVFLNDGLVAVGQVRLVGARIGGDLAFDGSRIRQVDPWRLGDGCAIRAEAVNVLGHVSLRRATRVRGEVRFINAKIGGVLSCSGALLECLGRHHASDGVALNAEGTRSHAVFFRREQGPKGSPTRFVGIASLVASRVRGDLQLQGLICKGRLDVDRTLIGETLQLDDSTDVTGLFDLSDARVARIHDSKGAWTACNRLNLNGFRYGSFTDECTMSVRDRIEWIERAMRDDAGAFVYSPLPYQQLARVFAEMGQAENAVAVRIASFRRRRTHECGHGFWDVNRRLLWYWRWLLDIVLDCGYARFRPLVFMLVLWMCGVGVFHWANTQRLMVPASDQVLTSNDYVEKGKLPPDYQPMNSFVYSADAMLPIIEFHQERFWLPKRDPDPVRWAAIANTDRAMIFGWPFPDAGRFLRWYLWFHIAAGWILSTLFVVGLSGIVKNEEGKTQDG